MSLSEHRRFQGRYWDYPILNAILEAIERWRQRIRERYPSRRETASAELKPTMRNVEVLKWIDYKGRKRELEIHREIEEAS